MYDAKIILDSVTELGERLTTFEVTYPRFVHSELMTHRVFSRNSSSSRAIPNARLIKKIKEDPAAPVWWGKNQSGMQAREEVDDVTAALNWWIQGRDLMIAHAEKGSAMGLHKQIVNRIIEPWMWITVIITATEFNNFFNLRCHPDAQPEIRHFAELMEGLYNSSEPQLLPEGEWHLPYIRPEEYDLYTLGELLELSNARCARVSYLTHDGEHDPEKDFGLAAGLRDNGHWSPSEHQGRSHPGRGPSGNFTGGWAQHRKIFFPGENNTCR